MPTPDPDKQTPITPEDRELGRKLVRPFLDMQGLDAIDAAERARQIIADHRAAQSATQLQTIGEAASMLAAAGRRLTEYGSDYGFTLIEKAKELRALARPAHPEELADKGGES